MPVDGVARVSVNLHPSLFLQRFGHPEVRLGTEAGANCKGRKEPRVALRWSRELILGAWRGCCEEASVWVCTPRPTHPSSRFSEVLAYRYGLGDFKALMAPGTQ